MSSRKVDLNDLVTLDMIAKRLGIPVSRVRNQALGKDTKGRPRFPRCLVGDGTRGVWSWEEVREWNEAARVNEIDARRRAAKRDKGMRQQRLPRTA